MSIDFPKYSIQEVSGTNKKFTNKVFFSSVVISFALGLLISNVYSKHNNTTLQKRNVFLEDSSRKNSIVITQLKAEKNILETDQKIKKQAVLHLQQEYKNLLNDTNNLKAEVAFYEKLLSPNKIKKGLRIFSTQIEIQEENNFVIKFTLVQKIEKAQEISGKFTVHIEGTQDGQPKKLQANINKESNYKFKYYQNISLNYLLPKGFNAEQLVVKLFPKNKKAKPVEFSKKWQIENKER